MRVFEYLYAFIICVWRRTLYAHALECTRARARAYICTRYVCYTHTCAYTCTRARKRTWTRKRTCTPINAHVYREKDFLCPTQKAFFKGYGSIGGCCTLQHAEANCNTQQHTATHLLCPSEKTFFKGCGSIERCGSSSSMGSCHRQRYFHLRS